MSNAASNGYCSGMTDKTPLVLVPGLLCTDLLWRAQLDGLADVAAMTVATAQREHDDLAAIAAAILAEAPARFALAGLSFGGYVCFEIMRRAPERVERLALLDTSARPDADEQKARRRALIELAQTGRFLGVTDRLLPLLIAGSRLKDAALVADVKRMAQDVGRDSFLKQQKAIMGRPDSRPDFARIACPTLVLCGRQDELTPLARHEEIAAGIVGSKLVVLEDCGHLSTMERPAEVNAALRGWLAA
jgi:pimeloyl-ACP methyl ester carboxylesterase